MCKYVAAGSAKTQRKFLAVCFKPSPTLIDELMPPCLVKLTAWVEAAMDKERKRQERVLAELKGQADHLAQEIKTAEHRCHQAETGVSVVSLRV